MQTLYRWVNNSDMRNTSSAYSPFQIFFYDWWRGKPDFVYFALSFIFHPNAERISLHGGHQFRIFEAMIHTWPNNDGGKKIWLLHDYNSTYTHVKINYKLGSTCKHENVLRGPLILWPNVSQIANQYVHQVQGTEITERHSKITIRNAGSRHL